MWAREYPVQESDLGLVSTQDPRRPVLLTRRNGTVIIGVSSHSPQYKPVLDSLIARHAKDLRDAPLLVVDLRGNEGGSSWMSDSLLPYILSTDSLPARYPERAGGAMMLSSPDQIDYAKRAFGPDTSRFVRTLVERLTSNPGRFVPLEEPGTATSPRPPIPVIYGPRRVAVLTDGGTVSASEVLVLKALRSTRVTVIGEPTEGALDYQSTNVVRILSPPARARWYLGYPTITRDTLLPLDRMRGHGIEPEIRVGWDTVANPIDLVEKLMRRPAQ
jgi:hypothetical protein